MSIEREPAESSVRRCNLEEDFIGKSWLALRAQSMQQPCHPGYCSDGCCNTTVGWPVAEKKSGSSNFAILRSMMYVASPK